MKLIIALALVTLISCKKYFQFSPNEVRLEEWEKNLNNKNILKLQSVGTKDEFKFAVIGDSQRFYDELNEFVNHINQRNDISFVLLNGDITDFGINKEFRWVNFHLSRLKVPYIAVIGNHDMLANGELIFQTMFGKENFSFSFSHCKFICLNSNSREHGFDGTLPDLNWLTKELEDLAVYEQVFVFCHVPPFNEDFDRSLEKPYADLLAKAGKVSLSIHGHEHRYSDSWPYGQDVEYIVTSTINKRKYAVVSVSNQKYTTENVEF